MATTFNPATGAKDSLSESISTNDNLSSMDGIVHSAHHNTSNEIVNDMQDYLIDIYTGWREYSDTWTYASATSFTISGVDVTDIFTKGTKIKWSEDGGSTFKYAFVASSSFSTDTTVNIIENDDYEFTNTTLSDTYFSYADNPQGFPHWFNYSPTWGGFSTDPSSGYTRFSVSGRTCRISIFPSSNGTSNTTSLTLTVPVASVDNGESTLGMWSTGVDNNSVLTTPGRIVLPGDSSTITAYKNTASAAWTASNGKRILFEFFYEF